MWKNENRSGSKIPHREERPGDDKCTRSGNSTSLEDSTLRQLLAFLAPLLQSYSHSKHHKDTINLLPFSMSFISLPKPIFQSYTPLSENELSPQEGEKDFQASRRSVDLESNGSISSHTSTLLDSTQVGPKRKFQVDARVISDAIIGLSDGLTVPFALTAGLSALGDTKVVIYGGLAELTAGAISMGLGGYLGARSEE